MSDDLDPNLDAFRADFAALTRHTPFPWQERLYAAMVGDPAAWPDAVDVPTGLGKTAAVACWLLALAHDASEAKKEKRAVRVPRRLVYVVNRRTIVDQVTSAGGGVGRERGQPRPARVGKPHVDPSGVDRGIRPQR